MKSLLRMTDDELAAVEAGSGFKPTAALGVAAISGLMAMAGMMLRYAPGDDVPISGMDNFPGQCRLAAGLAFGMLLTAFLIRGVVMQRLQWAVMLSLLIHLCLCLALKVVLVDVPVSMATAVGDHLLPPRDITLPDYGGMESQSEQQQQQWERPTDVTIPETEQQQLERQQAEMEPDANIDPLELQRQVTEANVPDRQQQEQERLRQEQQLELQRQQAEAQTEAPQQIDAPEIQTIDSRQPDLEAQQMNAQRTAESPEAARRMEELESRNDPSLEAATLAARSDAAPENDLNPEIEQRQKEAAAAAVAESSAVSVDVRSVSDAAQMNAAEREIVLARQAQAELAARDSAASPQFSAAEMQVRAQTPARSQNAANAAADATPTGGAAASFQRSPSANGQNASAANATADSVLVAAAGGASSPNLSASQAASEVARGEASIPSTAASGEGAPALIPSAFGVATLQSGTIGRSQGSESGPAMGAAVATGTTTGDGRRRRTNVANGAVGGGPQQVTVGQAEAGNDAAGQVVAAGPNSAATSVGRSGQRLPAGSGQPGNTAAAVSSSGREMTVASSSGRSGLASNSTSRNASLGNPVAEGRSGGTVQGSGRRSATATLPEGMLQAERSGALVVPGPQASRAGGGGGGLSNAGGLSGPRETSLPRQSAGLPGAGRGNVSVARSRPSLPGGLGASSLPGRAGMAATPTMASAGDVASMIRRTVPGISGVATERISAGFSLRTPEARREAVDKLGGSDASEAAVDRGLEWLAAHQFAAGNWSMHDPNCKDHTCSGFGSYESNPAATGLALLAFLGAGQTHQSGRYQQEVRRGLDWLLQNQKADGDLFAAEHDFAHFYSHGIAAIALCEAYGMTKDSRLQQPAQNSINFIVASQHPQFGGWRYHPQFDSDTSVSGWQLMAMKSAEMAGLKVPRSTYEGVAHWLKSVEDTSAPGRFRYHPSKAVTDSMTAEGLLMRQYLGAGRQDEAMQAGAGFLMARPPQAEKRDVYYWYYATQVMFHMQGEHWEAWNSSLRDMLVASQEKGGPVRGSWDAKSPTRDAWDRAGGRHYVTCLNLLMLEVYYRHLPLYIELNGAE
ncbi:MAG: hypothetical protein R3C59_25460 [Planctomycetaceae bacterium]